MIPLLILAGGTYRVLATAAAPYEEYLGVAVTAGLALAWAGVFVGVLHPRWSQPS